MEAPAKNMRRVRIHELPRHRNISQKNEFFKRAGVNEHVQALRRAVSRSEREWVEGEWDASRAPCTGEMLMKHIRDTWTFLKDFCAYQNRARDRITFSPDSSLTVFTIGVVPLIQIRIGK
jgi:hypothetical protein